MDTHVENSDIFVIIPAYNEGSVLRDHLRPLLERGYEVVVIDDASGDETWSVIRSLPVHGLRHETNLGQGAALQTGMTYALHKGARFVVHFDADGQHRVDDIPVLIAPLAAGEADVVLGSRFLRREDSHAVPRARRAILRTGVLVNTLLTGVRLSDAHNGFRALTAEAARGIDLRENRFAHATEILIQIRRLGLRCVERPTAIAYTDYSVAKGQSSLNAIKIVIDVVLRRIFR